MIGLLVTVLIVLLIFALIWWAMSIIPLPPGFPMWIVQVILAVILVLVLIDLLLPWASHPLLR